MLPCAPKNVNVIKGIQINRLIWAGHIIRRENEDIMKRIKLVKPGGKMKKK
jgi:hypothetical protein